MVNLQDRKNHTFIDHLQILRGIDDRIAACLSFFMFRCNPSTKTWNKKETVGNDCPHNWTHWKFESFRGHKFQKNSSICPSNGFCQCVALKIRRNWMIWGWKSIRVQLESTNSGSSPVSIFHLYFSLKVNVCDFESP
jgi:hypothetical protein